MSMIVTSKWSICSSHLLSGVIREPLHGVEAVLPIARILAKWKLFLDFRAPNVGLCNKWDMMFTVCTLFIRWLSFNSKSKEPTTSSDQHQSAHSKSGTWATLCRHLSYFFIGVLRIWRQKSLGPEPYAQVILHDAKWPSDRVDRALNLPSRPSSLQQLVDALYATCINWCSFCSRKSLVWNGVSYECFEYSYTAW